MRTFRCVAARLTTAILALGSLLLLAPAQYAPPAAIKPSEDNLKKIKELKDKLEEELRLFRRFGIQDPFLADIEVYRKAATWIEQHNEFYDKDSAQWTIEALERGLLRSMLLKQRQGPWFQDIGSAVVHGYRSKIDGSVQPYAVTLPADFGKERKKWRLEVVLHGRDNRLTEVSFLHKFRGDKPAPDNKDFIRLDVFGRGNNGYRWAGERDVIEAVENFLAVERRLNRADLFDSQRSVLRGFSMGGAGTWHLGLHFPDQWCVISPGAGFTNTHGYVQNLPKELPPYQEMCLSIYDAVDYAENIFNVPVVAYGGEKDPQLRAAQNIQDRLRSLKNTGNDKAISIKLLVAPGLEHKFPPEWQKNMAAARGDAVAKGREEYPPRVRFVTYTLKYPSCYWVYISGLQRHYERASVDAEHTEEGFKVKSSNVRFLRLQLPPDSTRQRVTVHIDGKEVSVLPYLPAANAAALFVDLEHRSDGWQPILPEKFDTQQTRNPRKMHGMQGPIDDAFTAPFLCVRGSGNAWHEATEDYAKANLERFRKEWSKYFRGELPVKDDIEVEPLDIATKHLILFGDPSSNSLIAQVLDGLPFTWTKDKITWDGKDHPAKDRVPVLIYPSPLSIKHYVVLNSGHTFHAADFQGSNALLYPRLGDYAILKLTGGKKDPLAVEVEKAGLFEDNWKTPPGGK